MDAVHWEGRALNLEAQASMERMIFVNKKRLSAFGLVVFAGLILVGFVFLSQARARAAWQQKVDPLLLDMAAEEQSVEFIVILREQADLSRAVSITDKMGKGAYVYGRLTTVAMETQPPVLKLLQAAEVQYRSYWVTNGIWVRGDAVLVQQLAQRSDVAQIHANPQVKLDLLASPRTENTVDDQTSIEWNISLVQAPEVWSNGVAGQGIVVGGQDTGYDWHHPALKEQYRGWDGLQADHDYNWHDAIHESTANGAANVTCGYDSSQPCDDHGHGTHTMGTMVGDDGQGNQIGMAPEAQWIACRNMKNGVGTPATYAECYEWFIAPYPLGGDPMRDGDPAKAPHVINNSWSCPESEGCTDPDILKTVVENVRAAGIITVHSAGNDGPACSTIGDAAAVYDASFSVAATSSNDFVANFSGRGPVTSGDNSPLKPDISAPGVAVRSSLPGSSYGSLSGTSMAAPHVAGLAALLMAAQPELIGDVDGLELAITESAVPLFTTENCGGDDGESLPNHVYGWGRIDAKTAYESVIATPEPMPTNTPMPPTATVMPPPTATGTITPTATVEPPSDYVYMPILIER